MMECSIMSNSGATMKKIAELAGVSITTVHRVLNNKEGCSEQLREKIYRIAQEQGYSVNYAAASMSKHTLNIVLLFPANGWGHNFFLQPMLNGYLAYRRDVSKFNVVFQEQYFGSNEGEDSPAKLLRDLYLKRPVECDGIVSSFFCGHDVLSNAGIGYSATAKFVQITVILKRFSREIIHCKVRHIVVYHRIRFASIFRHG